MDGMSIDMTTENDECILKDFGKMQNIPQEKLAELFSGWEGMCLKNLKGNPLASVLEEWTTHTEAMKQKLSCTNTEKKAYRPVLQNDRCRGPEATFAANRERQQLGSQWPKRPPPGPTSGFSPAFSKLLGASNKHDDQDDIEMIVTTDEQMSRGGLKRRCNNLDVPREHRRVKNAFATAREAMANINANRNNSSRGVKEHVPAPQAQIREDRQARTVRSGFVSPVRGTQYGNSGGGAAASMNQRQQNEGLPESTQRCLETLVDQDGQLPERLRNIEPRLIEHICNEIMTQDTKTKWGDIAGLQHAKQTVTEAIIWPLKRPDLFRGTRAPTAGLLLYGPPGTGKTMIGKAIAGETNATFFSISASSLTSKWIGEGEKLVRALFGVASCMEPAVIFIDEVDALLSQRAAEGEHESSRRLKTQFLIEMEGCTSGDQRVLVIGATNRPQELDEAARRRLPNRLYIPLPDSGARCEIIKHLLDKDGIMSLSEDDLRKVAEETEGYSGSDIRHVVREAAMIPLREAAMNGNIDDMNSDDIRSVSLQDFRTALKKVRSSVAAGELTAYEEWASKFGSGNLTGQG